MGQRFLQIPAPRCGNLRHLGAEEIIVPGGLGIVISRRRKIVEPDLDADQQALRRSDLELVESNVRLDLQPFEEDAGGADLQIRRDQTGEDRFRGHSNSRNWTSRSNPRKRWPESIVITCPVTASAPTRKRSAPTISLGSTPRPRGLLACIASKFSSLWPLDRSISAGAMPLTRI